MKHILAGFALLLGLISVRAQDTLLVGQTKLVANVLAEELIIPWDLCWGPDGWIWFNERDGDIYRLHPDDKTLVKVFTIPDVYESWDNSGFHAMELHPKFPIEPYIYTHYTRAEFGSHLVRWTYDMEQSTLKDSVVLLGGIGGNSSHNGSRIVFDDQGFLFLTIGDAFVSEVAQDVNNMNGKVLRMTQLGEIPEDNPIPGSYTWSYGHRNPQGLVIGRNGTLYSSEHGDATDDEVNIIEKGRNYGWPLVEGFCDQPSEMKACDSLSVAEPLSVWTPTHAPCGMAYFDHPSVPEWQNALLQTFLKEQHLTVLSLTDDGQSVKQGGISQYFVRQYGRLRDVMVSPTGRIFIATSNNETNGQWVTPDNYDKIIELVNPAYDYPAYQAEVYSVKEEATVFPNPSQGIVYLTLETQEAEMSIMVYSSSGELVQETKVKTIFPGLWQINLSQLSLGVYTLVYSCGEKSGDLRVVIDQR